MWYKYNISMSIRKKNVRIRYIEIFYVNVLLGLMFYRCVN